MWSNRITSFRSRHYPRSKQAFVVTQEYAMRYYAILSFIGMVGVVLRVYYQREVIIFGISAAVVSLLLGNLLANIQLRRNIAEIFFVNDGFSVISIHDILHQNPKRSFPLRFANPTRAGETIQFHFEDQIMTIKKEDWGEEFDLIWNWLNTTQADFVTSSTGDFE
jgi:hypothetical protein